MEGRCRAGAAGREGRKGPSPCGPRHEAVATAIAAAALRENSPQLFAANNNEYKEYLACQTQPGNIYLTFL